MEGWIEGWMDEWMDGLMDEEGILGFLNISIPGLMEVLVD